MRFFSALLLLVVMAASALAGEEHNAAAGGVKDTSSWARRIADSFLLRHPGGATYDTGSPNTKWNYEQGLMLQALHQMWLFTGGRKYFDFIQQNIDQYVDTSGRIATYELSDFNLDNIAPGRALLGLYEATHDAKYKRAADALRNQLRHQPRTHEGGFWHKKIYPYQMWLDGLYMAEPFYARYAQMFDEPGSFDDIADQFAFIARHTRDPKTGLFYHGWDESKQQGWANPTTGCSPMFWGRAIGWYSMALVDALDFFPQDHPRRNELLILLKDLATAVLKFRDQKTGLWYQVMDQGRRKGNYLEASASCMFAYSFAKGANKGYLNKRFLNAAAQTLKGIIKNLVTIDESGCVNLHHTCRGAGLGGKPYRDGSYEYYVSEPQRTNDYKGVGPFILAALEVEKGRK